MNEDGHVELVQLGVEGSQAFVIEIFAVDIAADFGAAQSQLANGPLQLARRHLRVLHRKVGESDEMVGMPAHGLGESVVDFPAETKTLIGIDGIKEKERRDREDLHVDRLSSHVL